MKIKFYFGEVFKDLDMDDIINKVLTKVDPDKEVIEKIKAGEVENFRLIMKKYNQKFYRMAISFGISDFHADDILQQTYIAAFNNLSRFKGESSFLTWLTRILINECLMHKRKQKSLKNRPGEALNNNLIMTSYNPENDYMKSELKAIIENSIAQLPEKYRTIYMIREVEGMSTKEAADILNISEDNVKIRLLRSKELMKRYLLSSFDKNELFSYGNDRCDRLADKVMLSLQEQTA